MTTLPIEDLTKQQSKAQTPLGLGASCIYGASGFIPGGNAGNPLNYPFWGDANFYSRPNYGLFAQMLRNPTLQHVRINRNAAIIASYFDYKPNPSRKVPSERMDIIAGMMDSIRERRIGDMLRYADYGWAGFENLWDNVDGVTTLVDKKPLAWHWTTILADAYGSFAGFQLPESTLQVNIGTVEKPQLVSGLPANGKASLLTHDRECDNLHGRSWLVNAIDPYTKFVSYSQELSRLIAKTSGIMMVVTRPNDPDIVKAVDSFLQNVGQGNNAIAVDSQAALYTGGFDSMSVDQRDTYAMLIASSVIKIDTVDMGSNGPAIDAIQALLVDNRGLMFEAGGLSPRTGLESVNGSRADATQHTDTGMLDAEARHDDIAIQLQADIDLIGMLNWADYKPGDIFIETPPLVDTKADRYAKIIELLSASTAPQAATILNGLDFEKILDGMELPRKTDYKFDFTPTQPAAQTIDPAAERRAARANKGVPPKQLANANA